jgi:hypothetical protein
MYCWSFRLHGYIWWWQQNRKCGRENRTTYQVINCTVRCVHEVVTYTKIWTRYNVTICRKLQQACGPSIDKYCDCYCTTFPKLNPVCLWACKIHGFTDRGYKHTLRFEVLMAVNMKVTVCQILRSCVVYIQVLKVPATTILRAQQLNPEVGAINFLQHIPT